MVASTRQKGQQRVAESAVRSGRRSGPGLRAGAPFPSLVPAICIVRRLPYSRTVPPLRALLALALVLLPAAAGPVLNAANGNGAAPAQAPPPVLTLEDAMAELAGPVASLAEPGQEFVLASSGPPGLLQGYVLRLLEVNLHEAGCRLRPLGRRLPPQRNGEANGARNGSSPPPDELPEHTLRQLRARGSDLLVLADATISRGQRYLRISAYELRDGRRRLLLESPFHLTDQLASLAAGKAVRMDRPDRQWLDLFDLAFPAGKAPADAGGRVSLAAAQYAFASGLWDTAAPLLADAATNGDRTLARAVMALQLGGDGQAAMDALAVALRGHPDSGPLWALKSWVSLRQGDEATALLWLEQARLWDMAREGLYRYARALIALEKEDDETARTELAEAADLMPDSLLLQRELARFRRNRAEVETAIECYRRAVAATGATDEIWREMALVLETAGRADEAIEALRTAFRMRSDSLATAGHLASLLRRTGLHDDALAVMRRATAADPFNAPLLAACGDTAMAMWLVDDAEKAYRAAEDADPAYHYARVRLASLLAARRDYREARALLTGLLAAAPQYHPARVALALVMADLGHFDGALAALQDASTSPEHEVAVQLAIARVQTQAGRPQDAVPAAQIAVASRSNAATYAALTRAFLATGETEKAQAALDAALRSDPRSAEALVAAARVSAARDDATDARARVDAALQADPYYVPAHELDGELCLAAGDHRRCAEAWLRALALNPWDAGLHRRLSDVLGEGLGEWAESRAHYARYTELAAQRADAAR